MKCVELLVLLVNKIQRNQPLPLLNLDKNQLVSELELALRDA
jgi:hypothetical protein